MLLKSTELEQALFVYFEREKIGALVLGTLGVTSVVAAVICWRRGGALSGAALPLAVLGAIESIVGAVVGFRTDGQVRKLLAALETDAAGAIGTELSRMERVLESFGRLKIAELSLFVIGLAGALLLKRHARWRAAAAAVAAQAILTFGFDIVAASRAEVYVTALRQAQTTLGTPAQK